MSVSSSPGADPVAGSPSPAPAAPGFFLKTVCCLCGKIYKLKPVKEKICGVSHGYCKECQENSQHPNMVLLRKLRAEKAEADKASTEPLVVEIAAKDQPFGMVQAMEEAARLCAHGLLVEVVE